MSKGREFRSELIKNNYRKEIHRNKGEKNKGKRIQFKLQSTEPSGNE
jgi:hypothetical protein